jgi:hypothetical protein
MRDFGLAVRYRLEGNQEPQVKEAARIELDGRGGLLLYSPDAGRMEHIDLHAVRQLSIQTICRPLMRRAVSAVA